MDNNKHDNLKDPFEDGWHFGRRAPDGQYAGNVFGWRVSLIGAALILLLGGFAIYRHYQLGVPFGMEEPGQTTAPAADSEKRDTLSGLPE